MGLYFNQSMAENKTQIPYSLKFLRILQILSGVENFNCKNFGQGCLINVLPASSNYIPYDNFGGRKFGKITHSKNW